MPLRPYANRERSDLRPRPVSGPLGQASPGAGILTDVYQVPATKRGILSLIVTNRGSSADSFRIAISAQGVAVSAPDYLAYDHPIEAHDSLCSDELRVGALAVVRVYSTGGNLSFTVNGFEEDE